MPAQFSRLLIVLVILALVAVPLRPSHAQEPSLSAYSVGVLQSDGTVLYSVLLASGEKALTDLTISGPVPEGATAVPVVAPGAAVLVTDKPTDKVQWQLKSVEAGTVVGPFTYRVTFLTVHKDLPASVGATVSWTGPDAGSIQAEQPTGPLVPLAEKGDIQLTSSGKVDDQGNALPVAVADTGIVVYLPDKAVSDPVTLHFTRLPFTDQNVPAATKDTWWCALVKIESDSQVTLAKPILIGLPTRQILTPGMPVQVLTRKTDTEDWKPLDTAQGVTISALGSLAVIMVTGTLPSYLAVGVSVKDRQASSFPASVVATQTGFGGMPKFSTATGSFAGRTH